MNTNSSSSNNSSSNHRLEMKLWDNIIRLFYSLFGGLLTLLFPLLSLFAIGILILLTSTIIFSSIRYSLLPKAIIYEPVYFNFATPEPIAKIDILASNRQWISNRDSYLDSAAQKSYFESSSSSLPSSSFSSNNAQDIDEPRVPSPSSSSSSSRPEQEEYKRYFKPSSTYTFHSTVEIAKSRRNMELGKFMISLRLFDSTGRVIARSSRAVVVPYQSIVSSTLQTLFLSPLVLSGLSQRYEQHKVRVTFMNDFVEPGHMQPPTSLVELSLSTNEADVVSTHLTVMPALHGIT